MNLLPRSLTAVPFAAALIAALPTPAPGVGFDDLYNPAPIDNCRCIAISINGRKLVNAAGRPPVVVYPKNGDYSFDLEVKSTRPALPSSAARCSSPKSLWCPSART